MNEVNMLNIGGVDYNIDDQHVRDLIAHSENGLDSQSNLPISSRHYDEGEYLIGQDRYYYEATTDIEPGDVLAEGTNLRKTILSDEIVALKNQSSIAVIQCIAKRETGALATSSYPLIGSYLYWDYGLTAGLYETIAAITAGDALTIGVNLKSANKIADTMDGLSDAYNLTGAKNLCPNNASDTTTTDITWDVLSDGSIQVSGTPAANRFLELGYATLPPGTYKVTTLAGQDEENSRVWLTVYAGSGYSNVIARSNSSSGTPNTFTLGSEKTVKMALNVSSGSAINTRVFPMCRVASITDDTYVPFAMTNKQLTDEISKFAKYSTSETFTGKYWINGKPIYRKVIDFGNLPNSATKGVDHNISGLSFVTSIQAIAYSLTENITYQMLTFATSDGIQYTIRLYCNSTQVVIGAGSDRSGLKAYVIMEYTK